MAIQQMIDSVATQSGIDTQVAEKAVGTILSVLQHEAGPTADGILAKIPGSAELATRFDVMGQQQGGGGLFSTIGNLIGQAAGEKIGALVNGVEALKETGMTTVQIRQAGQAVLAQAEQAAGPDAIQKLLQMVPGLAGHFGM